jgi:hypothetical protein
MGQSLDVVDQGRAKLSILAILLASATVASLAGLRSTSLAIHVVVGGREIG